MEVERHSYAHLCNECGEHYHALVVIAEWEHGNDYRCAICARKMAYELLTLSSRASELERTHGKEWE